MRVKNNEVRPGGGGHVVCVQTKIVYVKNIRAGFHDSCVRSAVAARRVVNKDHRNKVSTEFAPFSPVQLFIVKSSREERKKATPSFFYSRLMQQHGCGIDKGSKIAIPLRRRI